MKVEGHIVLTSIQAPSRQVEAFCRQRGWEVVFVADLKTPDLHPSMRIRCLTVEEQKNGPWSLGRLLPWNHYARKNIGYLHAMADGSLCIFDTDDDNLPLEPWMPDPSLDRLPVCGRGGKWVNAYAHFGGGQVWPRGFPLEQIGCCEPPAVGPSCGERVVVWQGLVGGDPDVDAIFRLTRPERVVFRDALPIVLGAGSYCPFNSQNTLWAQCAFPYLYLPATVSFRFTDILRGLVAQRCFWAHGWRLGFHGVTAWQERNPHDLLSDFQDELPSYLHASQVAQLLDALDLGADPAGNLRTCYRALQGREIVQPLELELLEHWLEAVASCRVGPDVQP